MTFLKTFSQCTVAAAVMNYVKWHNCQSSLSSCCGRWRFLVFGFSLTLSSSCSRSFGFWHRALAGSNKFYALHSIQFVADGMRWDGDGWDGDWGYRMVG